MIEISRIRNLCLLAHIDHGKSTLADRMLEICGAVEERDGYVLTQEGYDYLYTREGGRRITEE